MGSCLALLTIKHLLENLIKQSVNQMFEGTSYEMMMNEHHMKSNENSVNRHTETMPATNYSSSYKNVNGFNLCSRPIKTGYFS